MSQHQQSSVESPVTVFIHIPKTGGMTLNSVLQRVYGPGSDFFISADTHQMHHRTPDEIRAYSAQLTQEVLPRLSEIKYITGHLGFGALHPLPVACRNITILRDPVDRLISLYFFCVEHGWVAPGRLEAFVNGEENYRPFKLDVNNLQTRYIGAINGISTDIGFDECPPELLDRAQENLKNNFSVVGLTHRYNESLLLMKQAFGWPAPLYLRQNKTRRRLECHQVSPQVLAAIKHYNAMDFALYQHAQTLFEAQIAQYPGDFSRDLRMFELQNNLYTLVMKPYGMLMETAIQVKAKHFPTH